MDELRLAFGSRWVDPQRRWDGWVWGRDAGIDFNARVTVAQTIGRVSFHGNFPAKYEIEGLKLGMSLDEVRSLRPGLEPDDSGHSSVVAFKELLGGGVIRSLRFLKSKLGGMDLALADCEYPRKDIWLPAPAGFYPESSGEPGAPFADPNLKLNVLNCLRVKRSINLGSDEDLVMHVLGRYVDVVHERDFRQAVYDYLVRYPLDSELLSQVRCLSFGGDTQLYSYIWPQWDGDGDEFTIRSLEGIEHCAAVEEWTDQGMIHATDLTPLGLLPELRDLELNPFYETGFQALLRMKKLKTLRHSANIPADILRQLHIASVDLQE